MSYRTHDLGISEINRALLSEARQMVGPSILFEKMGLSKFLTERTSMRAHLRIGPPTVTCMFNSSILHRGRLGLEQPIASNGINWIIVSRASAHSERIDPALRDRSYWLFGI